MLFETAFDMQGRHRKKSNFNFSVIRIHVCIKWASGSVTYAEYQGTQFGIFLPTVVSRACLSEP
jgi:hypothetical protein